MSGAVAKRPAYLAEVRLAYDRVGVPVRVAMPPPRAVVQGKPSLTVLAALEWAFARECAQLDFDDAGGWVVGADCVWRLMQRHALGCAVDGGGRSRSHHDADVIATVVAALPIAHGGRSMAVRVAELARAGRVPDPMAGARPACVPVSWRGGNQYGRDAATECVAVDSYQKPGQRRVMFARVACPVTYTPTAAQIASAQREWLRWRGAVRWIMGELRIPGVLDSLTVTDDLPPVPNGRV
jgi:hypothetical protein